LAARGIPYLDWKRDVEPKIEEMKIRRARGEASISYNGTDWGFAKSALTEARIGSAQ